MLVVRFSKLDSRALTPSRKHKDDAGMDFYALGDYIVQPNSVKVIRTGITIEWPLGFMGLAKPKGSHDYLIGAGVIDAGYQGEMVFKVFNILNEIIIIRHGDAVAQVVILPVVTPNLLVEINDGTIHREKTARGDSGGIHNS